MISSLRWAWSLTKDHRWQLLSYFLLELLHITASLCFVLWAKKTVDLAMGSDVEGLCYALILTVGSVVIRLLAGGYAGWLNERVRLHMLVDVQKALVRAQMWAIWKRAKAWHSGDILVRLQEDANEVVYVIGYMGFALVLTGLRLLASFGFLWTLDPTLAWLILAISPLFFLAKVYVKKLRRLNRQLKAAESEWGYIIQENLRFSLLIRALGLGALRWKKFENSQTLIYGYRSSLLDYSMISRTVMKWTLNGGGLLAFIWGVYRLHANEISFGTVTAFLQLVGRVQSPLFSLAGFFPQFIRFSTSVERLQVILNQEQEEDVAQQRLVDVQAIYVENVSFRYNDEYVIDQLNVSFKQGHPVAIMGASGRGKTTLLRLLLSLIKPEKGSIWIQRTQGDAVLMGSEYRVNIAYVPQGDKVFSGTVWENLMLGDVDVTDDRIRQALYLSCAEFVYDFPQGLDTVIGESGLGLSEGQAQRIALARSMIRGGQLWLFDEVTAALDQETAQELIARLLQAGKDKILVFVTHDEKVAECCDQTLYL